MGWFRTSKKISGINMKGITAYFDWRRWIQLNAISSLMFVLSRTKMFNAYFSWKRAFDHGCSLVNPEHAETKQEFWRRREVLYFTFRAYCTMYHAHLPPSLPCSNENSIKNISLLYFPTQASHQLCHVAHHEMLQNRFSAFVQNSRLKMAGYQIIYQLIK